MNMDKFYYKAYGFFQSIADWFGERISEELWDDIDAQIDFQIEEQAIAMGKVKIEVFGVVEGPIHRDSIPNDDGVNPALDWLLEVKGSINNSDEIDDISLWFKDFNEAYALVSHFYHSVEPKVFYL